MNSPFLINYDKANLYSDIGEFCVNIIDNMNKGLLKKKYTNILWFLTETLDIIEEYDYYYPEFNLLTDNQYQNLINAIQQILNKEYYGYNR